jgi:hypothetical protein
MNPQLRSGSVLSSCESGRVYLELADATPAEAARGMALITKLVG